MKKTESINIRVTPELYEQAKACAEAEHRSLANWVELAILEKLEKKS